MKKVAWIFVIVLFSICLFQAIYANESEHPDAQKKETKKEMVGPWKNFNLNLGASLTAFDSSVRFGVQDVGVGIDVDVEDALGIDSSTVVFFGGGYYRFGSTRRHRFDFSYVGYRRDSTRVISDVIPIFDEDFQPGDTLTTEFNFDVIRAGYSYSFLPDDDRIDLGIGGGLYVMPIEFSVSSPAKGVRTEDITAPLPVLTLRGDFALTPKLFLKASTDVFYLKIGNFEGSILAGNLAIEYDFWKNVGFGLGFNNFYVQIDAEDDDYPNINFLGEIDFSYRGLLLYTKIYF